MNLKKYGMAFNALPTPALQTWKAGGSAETFEHGFFLLNFGNTLPYRAAGFATLNERVQACLKAAPARARSRNILPITRLTLSLRRIHPTHFEDYSVTAQARRDRRITVYSRDRPVHELRYL